MSKLEQTVSVPSYILLWFVELLGRLHYQFHQHICVRYPRLQIRHRLDFIPLVKRMKVL